MHDVIKTKGHGSIFDFTSQTALRCKISSKTECKAVWDVKSRMDPCLSQQSWVQITEFCQVYETCKAQKKRNSANHGVMFALDGMVYNILHAL